MDFAQVMRNNSNTKTTENGAPAYSTTNNILVDLFGQIGAMRERSESDIANKFAAAFAADPVLATKMMFYAGNIRGGLGERRTFRICLRWLAKNRPSIVIANIANIPHYNRWDSLFELIDTPAEDAMWSFIGQQIGADLGAAIVYEKTSVVCPISLLAKWMPTETASSNKTRDLARRAMKALTLTPRIYRKAISRLRKYLKVVETSMSAGEWQNIDYESVPSYAMKNYREAFGRHDPVGFGAYCEELEKGKAKVNASTLYPYDLVKEVRASRYFGTFAPDPIIEAQWSALPNYVNGENNILIMADVSSSMECAGGRPMNTSIGLATYFAQRNKGAYHNLYMTFSREPHFVELTEGASFASTVLEVMRRGVGYNTDLEKAFLYILRHAIANNVSNTEMPKALVIISDMEIDDYARRVGFDFVEEMKHKFAMHGYTMPTIVCWNVEARNDTFLSKSDDVLMVSGQSPSVFRELCGRLNGKTSWDIMVETLSNPMYDRVVFDE